MTLLNRKLSVLFFIFCYATIPIIAQQNLLNYKNSLKFARYLTNTQQYAFAVQEYERLNFLWPEDTTVILELVKTYRLNLECNQFPNAFQMVSANNKLHTSPAFAEEYLRFCLTCKIEHPQFFNIASNLKQDKEAFFSLSYYWANHQYDSAFAYNFRNADIISGKHPQLYDVTIAFDQQKYKSPMLAMAMSVVLPGSGKAYSKRWGDASISFLLVASSAFASYRAFKQKGVKSFNGWVFGGVAFSFYASNLYGSYKSAKTYNENLRIQYQNHAERVIYNTF